MIDTIEMSWKGSHPPGPAEIEDFKKVCGGAISSKMWEQEGEEGGGSARAWTGQHPAFGSLTLNADGFFRVQGRSLAKIRQVLRGSDAKFANNNEILTARQANDAFQDYAGAIEEQFIWLEEEDLRVQRFDIAYQRPVASSFKTISALKGAINPTRKGAAWFDNQKGVPTGVFFKGISRAHRVYDKGLESGDKAYSNVLRSEEQLRKESVPFGQILDITQRIFNRDAARQTMNDRYLDEAFSEEIDVTDLVKAGLDTQALLILHPELLPAYRERVQDSAYYAMMKKVRRHRATAIPADLRLPESAWIEKVAA